MDDIKVICDICDEEIRIRKYEDATTAYARHSQSTYHVEVQKTFRSIKLGEVDTAFSNKSATSSEDIAENEPSMLVDVSYKFESLSLFFCKLCQVEVTDSLAMMVHVQSEKHVKMENFVKNMNLRREKLQRLGFTFKQTFPVESKDILAFFSNMDSEGMRLCLVCSTKVPSDLYHLLGHINFFEVHRNLFNALFTNVATDDSFRCVICDAFGRGEEKFNEHCGCEQHRSAIDSLCTFASEFL